MSIHFNAASVILNISFTDMHQFTHKSISYSALCQSKQARLQDLYFFSFISVGFRSIAAFICLSAHLSECVLVLSLKASQLVLCICCLQKRQMRLINKDGMLKKKINLHFTDRMLATGFVLCGGSDI